MSPRVYRTLFSILSDLNNAVVWMVSIRPPISNNFSSLFKFLKTVPSMLIRICITVNLTLHSFLSSLARSKHLSLFRLFWYPLRGPPRRQSSRYDNFLIFSKLSQDLVFWPGLSFGLVFSAGIGWSVCILKSKRILCISFFRTNPGLRM